MWHLIKKLSSKEKAVYLVIFLILGYTVLYSLVNISRYNHFEGTFGYDLGIQDQGIWLLSQGERPFVTIRGLHLFGDHIPLIYIFISVLYWFWENISILLIFHTFFIALGALPVFLISNWILKKQWLSLFLSVAYLTYPPLTYLNLDLLFSESFAPTLLLFSFYFLLRKKFLLHYIFLFMILLCKEDIFVIVFMIGIYTFFKVDKKKGVITCGISILWFILGFFVILPYFNGIGYFRHLYGYSVFGQFGSTPSEIIKTIIFEPKLFFSLLFTPTNMKYLFHLLIPLGFVSIIGFEALLIAVPSILINILSGYHYTHFVTYHYTAAIIPFIFISVIFGIKRISKKSLFLPILALLFLSVFLSSFYLGPYYSIVRNPKEVISTISKMDTYSQKEHEIYQAISKIPEEAVVSASYNLLPHLSHREKIYVFPVPFKALYWGVNGENLPSPATVDFFILDKKIIEKGDFNMYIKPLINVKYAPIFETDGVLVLNRKS